MMAATIISDLCPSSKYSIKCPYAMTPIGICIHNTANDASAKNEASYMLSNNNQVSFHYAVDDKEIVHCIPNDRNAWHAGDGGKGEGNRKYISIEICYSKSGGGRFEAAMENAAYLTAKLLRDYGWNISNVKKHQDFSGKYCPHRILSDYGWGYFLNLVREALGETAVDTDKRPLLKSGMSGSVVRLLQRKLNKAGFELDVDGIFGEKTLAAVKSFQSRSGLNADGIVDPMTWVELEEVSGMARFPDTVGHWAEEIIDELAEMGIVQGDNKGRFRPDASITRAEAAVMIGNAVKYATGKSFIWIRATVLKLPLYIAADEKRGRVAITRPRKMTLINNLGIKYLS